MTVTIEPLHCGTLTAPRSMFEAPASDDPIELPVPAWLVRHPSGTVLFDTGMPAARTEPGPMLDAVSLFFGVGMETDSVIDQRLQASGSGASDIDIVVLSHLHFDHTGGLSQLPDARVVIQADEWAAGVDDELAASNTFQTELFDLGHDRQEVDGEYDLFGDGLVVCVPTPGHTPGHQSLRVRLADREVVLCGDCAYYERTLDGGPLPPIGHDHEQQAKSIERLRSMRDAGALLIPGHDPESFHALPSVLT